MCQVLENFVLQISRTVAMFLVQFDLWTYVRFVLEFKNIICALAILVL